ncbi:hypothetical protein CUN60_04795 [Aquella oligotrophica]|uniref:DUF2844 domain-containing protein n=2 Tax=Aquella oligotrophica TaxID=2067065 RepID=A0A2I7N597_9NEIS|nr:hypothetical protein CUN60_04795 [Aquella oligotrophica]
MLNSGVYYMKQFFVILMVAIVPLSAHATLGENPGSIESDNKALASSISTPSTKMISQGMDGESKPLKYQVSTIKATGGITVKEYVSNGKVFAVSWVGMRNPDLQQLFGKYFPEFKTTKSTGSGLRSSHVSAKDLIVNIYGVTGDFHGLAYIPSLLPTGLNPQDLLK